MLAQHSRLYSIYRKLLMLESPLEARKIQQLQTLQPERALLLESLNLQTLTGLGTRILENLRLDTCSYYIEVLSLRNQLDRTSLLRLALRLSILHALKLQKRLCGSIDSMRKSGTLALPFLLEYRTDITIKTTFRTRFRPCKSLHQKLLPYMKIHRLF
jgi:hypothetical protein